MAYCRHCQQEFPDPLPLEKCPVCGHLLLPRKPIWRSYDPREPLEKVCTVQGEPEAEMLKGLLEQEGIPVVILRESAGLVFGVTIDGLGAQRLLVPKSLAAAAREILAGPDQAAGEPPSTGLLAD